MNTLSLKLLVIQPTLLDKVVQQINEIESHPMRYMPDLKADQDDISGEITSFGLMLSGATNSAK